MIRTQFVFALFAIAFLPVSAQEIKTIPSAEISFVFVAKDVDGSIAGFESSSRIDTENITASTFKGSVAVETLKTGNFLRDWSLKGGKYFDADDHPKITFSSTSVTTNGSIINVEGNLTIKGTTKPVSMKFQQKDDQLVGTPSLYSSDFGIDIKKERADNKVEVNMVLQLKN